VLKDFDIEKEAHGVDKAVIRSYWAGKGTKNIPKRGTYGTLISAINIDSGE